MPSLLSPHRSRTEISLQATEPHEEPTTPLDLHPEAPPVAWPLAAAVAGLVAAVAGWILAAGITVVGWLAAPAAAAGSLAGALGAATDWWVLAHGLGAVVGGVPVTLIPWGATIVFAAILARCTMSAVAWSGRRWGEDQEARPAVVATAAALAWLGYVIPVTVAALFAADIVPGPRLLATAGLLAVAAAWSCARALGHRSARGRPAWAQALPRAVGSGLLILLAGGAAVVVTGLWRHLDRVDTLTAAADAGIAGTLVLWLLQLAYVPTAVVWGAAYALGAGISLGPASLVSPAVTELGVLPGVPLLGGLPAEGPGAPALLAWLGVGVLAGALPAWLVARARPTARVDETCLVGALSGVVVALAFVVLAWSAGGDFGADRLSGLGPRLQPLLVLAGSTLGLAGMGTGLMVGLVRWWQVRATPTTAVATPDEGAAFPREAADATTSTGFTAPAGEPAGGPDEPTTVLEPAQSAGASDGAGVTR